MNENLNNNQTSENSSTSPYKAMGNLNTAISNPNAVINNTMDINIQSQNMPSVNNNDDSVEEPNNNVVNEPPVVQANAYIPKEDEVMVSDDIKRTYVTNDNKPKKRTVKIKFGPELKIALLIIVILLVFIFILPLLPNF